MKSGAFSFEQPPVDPARVSPAGEPIVYVAGRSPQARHASQQAAAQVKAGRATKTAAYLELLGDQGPMTDHAASLCLRVPLSSVCSIRNAINDRYRQRLDGPRVESVGQAMSPFGKRATVWRVIDAWHDQG